MNKSYGRSAIGKGSLQEKLGEIVKKQREGTNSPRAQKSPRKGKSPTKGSRASPHRQKKMPRQNYNRLWVEKPFEVELQQGQIAELLEALKSVPELSCKVAYEGFSPDVIRESIAAAAEANNRDLSRDMVDLLTVPGSWGEHQETG